MYCACLLHSNGRSQTIIARYYCFCITEVKTLVSACLFYYFEINIYVLRRHSESVLFPSFISKQRGNQTRLHTSDQVTETDTSRNEFKADLSFSQKALSCKRIGEK